MSVLKIITFRLQPLILFVWIYGMLTLLSGKKYLAFVMPDYLPLLIVSLLITIFMMISTFGQSYSGQRINVIGSWLNAFILVLPIAFMLMVKDHNLGGFALMQRDVSFKEVLKSDPHDWEVVHPPEATDSLIVKGGYVIKKHYNISDADKIEAATPEGGILINEYTELNDRGDQIEIIREYAVNPDTVYKTPKLESLPPEEVDVMELIAFKNSYNGRNVIVEGLTYIDPDMTENSIVIYRFGITCCIADAQPLQIIVVHDDDLTIENDIWIEVKGKVEIRKQNNRKYVIVDAGTINEIDAPPSEEQYLFY